MPDLAALARSRARTTLNTCGNMSHSDYTLLFISKPIALHLLLTNFTLHAYFTPIFRHLISSNSTFIQPTSVTLPTDSPELHVWMYLCTLFTYTPVTSLCTPPVSSCARSCCLALSGAAILGVAKLLFRWCSKSGPDLVHGLKWRPCARSIWRTSMSFWRSLPSTVLRGESRRGCSNPPFVGRQRPRWWSLSYCACAQWRQCTAQWSSQWRTSVHVSVETITQKQYVIYWLSNPALELELDDH